MISTATLWVASLLVLFPMRRRLVGGVMAEYRTPRFTKARTRLRWNRNTLGSVNTRIPTASSGTARQIVRLFAQSQQTDKIHIHDEDEQQQKCSLPTVASILTTSYLDLVSVEVPEPEESVIHLLSTALDLPWETGYRDLRKILMRPQSQSIPSSNNLLANQVLTAVQFKTYQALLVRRKTMEPIQYLTGQWDFLDYVLTVRHPLLCPRPETEELVELVREDLATLAAKNNSDRCRLRILDVGCGTGCIGVSLAAKLPNSFVEAIDVEHVAVATATENAERVLGAQYQARFNAQLCEAEVFDVATVQDRFDAVVSNPPYIPRADMGTLETTVVDFESETALCGGEDGLDVVRSIVKKLPFWCVENAVCWMEVDPTHPALLRKWLESDCSLGVVFVHTYRDLYGNDRFVKLRVTRTK
jgi:release factor glutamine methyltransferase